jgi:hypothetical protein
VDLTESEKERFEKLVKEGLKAAKALSKNFKFKTKEVKKPYSHSVLVKPNDYAKQEDILVNDLRDTLIENNLDLDLDDVYFDGQGNLDLNRAYFNALNEVEDTDAEISFLLRKYTKTLDEEGKKEAKMLFTQKDGIEDLSKDLKTQVGELNKVVKKNLEIRVAAYIKLMKEELAAVKVKTKDEIANPFSEKEVAKPMKKDSILNYYYKNKKENIEDTLETIKKLISKIKVTKKTENISDKEIADIGMKETLLKNLRDIYDYLSRSREIRPVGTTKVGEKEVSNKDTNLERHKFDLNRLSNNLSKTVVQFDGEETLLDEINKLKVLLGNPKEFFEKELKVKKMTLSTTTKIAEAIKYKGSLAKYIRETLLEQDENATRNRNTNIGKQMEKIFGREVRKMPSRIRLFEEVKENSRNITKKDVKNSRFVDFQSKSKAIEIGLDSTEKYNEMFSGYSELIKNGKAINEELNKYVDKRSLFDYFLDYVASKGSKGYSKSKQKRIKQINKLTDELKIDSLKKIAKLKKESPLFKKYGVDKLQNRLLSDYDAIEEAIDEMQTRGITSVESMERMGVDFTSPEDIVDYFIGKIDSTYFPRIRPTFYPMSEGQNKRITILITRNILKIMTKLGVESNFSEEERATILQRLAQNEEEE